MKYRKTKTISILELCLEKCIGKFGFITLALSFDVQFLGFFRYIEAGGLLSYRTVHSFETVSILI